MQYAVIGLLRALQNLGASSDMVVMAGESLLNCLLDGGFEIAELATWLATLA